MPRVAPFRGLTYDRPRFGRDLSDLVCPPYDVIGPELQQRLLARHERNAVRLELSAEAEPHAAAARTLESWRADGTLRLARSPRLYRYAHASPAEPDRLAVAGALVRVGLEPWGEGITPHEHTLPGPKADRLALLRSTRTQLSPILVLYFDESGADLPPGDDADAVVARDEDGLLHEVRELDAEPAVLEALAAQRLFVADGHHRYETARAYQEIMRSDPRFAASPPGSLAADWIMAVLVNAARMPITILPTHRLILDADPFAIQALAEDPGPFFTAKPMPADRLASALDDLRPSGPPAFGLVLPDGEGHLLEAEPAAVAERTTRTFGSQALRGLDLSVLHEIVLGERLGIGPEAVETGDRVAYTRDAGEAIARVGRGEAQAAFLVRPTPLEQLAAVARAGEVMPQKSTYFYPKLLTGLVFNLLED
jgi:uncharacterized protein (DUF1015 family)